MQTHFMEIRQNHYGPALNTEASTDDDRLTTNAQEVLRIIDSQEKLKVILLPRQKLNENSQTYCWMIPLLLLNWAYNKN